MRKVTATIAAAFKAGKAKRDGNTTTDGTRLFLFGRCIAEKLSDGLWVSDGGYGYSVTTAERLKPFCSVNCRKGQMFLNGQSWDGKWTKID